MAVFYAVHFSYNQFPQFKKHHFILLLFNRMRNILLFITFQIMDFPLDQKWYVELHGDVILTLEFKVQGEMTRLAIEMPKTQSYATFGGNNFDNH